MQIQLVGEGQLTFSDVFLTPTWGLHLGSPMDGGGLTLAAGTTRALYGSPSGAVATSGGSSHLPSPQSETGHSHGTGSQQCPSPVRQRQHQTGRLAATILRLKQRNRVLTCQRESAERDRASAQNFVHMLQQENAQLKERSVGMRGVRA